MCAYKADENVKYDVTSTGVANEGAKIGLSYLVDMVKNNHIPNGTDRNKMDTDFSNLDIERRENRKRRTGVRICGEGRKFFIPCYNEQNGYYNDRLDIVLIDTNQFEKTHIGWWNREDQYAMRYKIVKTWENVPTIDDIY